MNTRQPEISRSDFLKGAASAAAAVAVGTLFSRPLRAFARTTDKPSCPVPKGQWKPSTCQGCTSWCAIQVYVEDGREEPVRSARLGEVSLSTLRHIAAVTKRRFVYNTLASANRRSGIPASFIVPEALMLEEIEVKNEKRGYTPKLPVVPPPLAVK